MNGNSDAFVTTHQLAYNYIREQILLGNYSGGMHLDLAKIASILNISRMPIRDALRQLDAEGLVVMRPNRRAVVTSLTPLEVEQLFEMRAVLEALSVRYVVAQLDDNATYELKLLKDRMDHARHDRLLWIQRHNEFHHFISNLSDRKLLSREINLLLTAVQPYVLMYINIYGKTEMEGYEHDELLAAILSGDAERAEACMRDHVLSTARGIVSFLEERKADGTGRQPDLVHE